VSANKEICRNMNIIYEVLNSKLWHYTNCIYYTEATLQYIA